MDEMAMPKRVLKGKLHAKRRIGRPRLRWADDVTDDLRKMGIRGWTEKARNRDQWRLIFKEAKAHPGLKRRAEEEYFWSFISYRAHCHVLSSFSLLLHPCRSAPYFRIP
jgi:hypothetical protein